MAEVFLVDADYRVLNVLPVVALYDDRRLIVKSANARSCREEARSSSGIQTQVFVQVVIIEAGYCWLEYVRCRYGAVRNPPAAVYVQQGCLRLSPGETELSSERIAEPCRGVGLQFSKSLRNFTVR